MEKLNNMVKHFSSTITNRKNCNDVLENHRYLPTNQSEQDHNGARIVTECKLIKLALRKK